MDFIKQRFDEWCVTYAEMHPNMIESFRGVKLQDMTKEQLITVCSWMEGKRMFDKQAVEDRYKEHVELQDAAHVAWEKNFKARMRWAFILLLMNGVLGAISIARLLMK